MRRLKTKDGHLEHQSYCYLIPLATSSPKEALEQAKKDLLKNNTGIEFDISSSYRVLLGDITLYSSMNGSTKNLQLAYLAIQNNRLAFDLNRVAYPE